MSAFRGRGDSSVRAESRDQVAQARRQRRPPSLDQVLLAIDPLDSHHSVQQLRPLLEGLSSDDFQSLLIQIERDGREPSRGLAIKLVAQQFGRIDSHGAIRFASDPNNSRFAQGMIGSAIAVLVRESPEAALQAVREIRSLSARKDAMGELLAHLASSEPRRLGAWLKNEDLKEYVCSQPWSVRSSVQAWASRAPAEAAAFAEELPRGQLRDSVVGGVAASWAQRDPDAALAWARGLGDELIRRSAVNSMMTELLARKPQSALDLLDESEGAERDGLVRAIASSLSHRDPEKALEWVATLEDPKDFSEAIGSMANFSPEYVEKFTVLLERLPERQRRGVGHTFVGNLAQHDPASARAWVASIEDPKEKVSYVRELIRQHSHSDPALAIEVIKQFDDPMASEDYDVEGTFTVMAARDMDAAREAAAGLEDGERKFEAMKGIVNSWARYDPEAAAEYVLESYQVGVDQREMLGGLADQWASHDAEAALAWANELDGAMRISASDRIIQQLSQNGSSDIAMQALASLIEEFPDESSKIGRLGSAIHSVMTAAGWEDPQAGIAVINQLNTEGAQKNAIGPLINSWAEHDMAEAREWVEQLEPGSVRDNAVVYMAWQLSEDDAPAAFELACSLDTEEHRLSTLQHAISNWSKSDAEAAREAIEASSLSDGDRQALIDQIE